MSRVAVVGSGPAGCYTAQALLRELPDVHVSVFERLPVPFGLIRYGVAPDHQGTKAIARQFDRVLQHERVTFVGGVHVGSDVELEELRAEFDAVVVATGLYRDRSLGIPGEDLSGVIAAGPLTRWMNSHPEEVGSLPPLGRRVVVVGNGNVAIDVVRLLAKAPQDLEGSDLSPEVAESLERADVREIVVAGRSPISQAKFDPAMVKELAQIAGATFEADLPASEDGRQVEALRALLERQRSGDRAHVRFHFGWVPQSIDGDSRVEQVAFIDSSGSEHVVPTDTVVSAIGFTGPADLLQELPEHRDGRIDDGLYCVGWARYGARGTIPDARTDARLVAKSIAADLRAPTHLVSIQGASA